MFLFFAPCMSLLFKGTWSADPLSLTSAAVLRGVWDCPSLDTESLWLCSRYTSVPEVGLLLELDHDKMSAKSTEDQSLPCLLPQSPVPAPTPDASS